MLALRSFALFAGLFQLAVAAHLVRKPLRPFRCSLALLLLFNGLAAVRLAVLGGVPVERWFHVLDGATGPMLFASGSLLARFPDQDRVDRRGWAIVLASGAVAAVLVALAAYPPLYDAVGAHAYEWLHTLPASIGLALAGVALARALPRARASEVGEAGFVALGFLPTLAENGAWAVDHLRSLAAGQAPFHLARVTGQAAVLGAAAVAFTLLLWPRGGNRGWRQVLAITMAAGAMSYLAFWKLDQSDPQRVFAVYLGTTFSFYILRPLGVGLAYARSRTLWSLYDLGCLSVALVLGKLASWALVGTPLGELRFADLLGIGVAFAVLPVALVAPRLHLRVRGAALDRVPSETLLARFLLEHRRRHGAEATAGKADIEAATGISENNLAKAVLRLESSLGATGPGSFVQVVQVGVRGRKRYRLTAAGADALERARDRVLEPS